MSFSTGSETISREANLGKVHHASRGPMKTSLNAKVVRPISCIVIKTFSTFKIYKYSVGTMMHKIQGQNLALDSRLYRMTNVQLRPTYPIKYR